MRRSFALLLVAVLCFHSATAEVTSQSAIYSGGTRKIPPEGAIGVIDIADAAQLKFVYKAGRSFESGKFHNGALSLPYAKVNRLVYGHTKALSPGQKVALMTLGGSIGALVMLSREQKHYLTIDFEDETNQAQTLSFELENDDALPFLQSLENRTGKKIQYEAANASTKAHQP
jgi:hypothetical protein